MYSPTLMSFARAPTSDRQGSHHSHVEKNMDDRKAPASTPKAIDGARNLATQWSGAKESLSPQSQGSSRLSGTSR